MTAGCPHCGQPVFRASTDGSRMKARTSILVLHKSGEMEINCAACKNAIILPAEPANQMQLRKAERRFVILKA